MKKELSGLFLSPARFQASLEELLNPDCNIDLVKLYHNQPAQVKDLLSVLASGNTSVQHVDMYEVDEHVGCTALRDFLASPTSTCRPTAITINTLPPKAAAALGHGLASPQCQVSELSLSSLPDASLAAVLQPLAACTTPSHVLHRLTLVKCIVGPASVQCLHVLSHISHLSFTDCVISDTAGEHLIQILAGSHMDTTTTQLPPNTQPAGLESLILTGSHAGACVSRAVSDLLLACTHATLRHLCLDGSVGLGDNGASQLAVGLAVNRSLTTLSLSHCGIGISGAKALAGALTRHATLETLILNDNNIGAEGFMAILLAQSFSDAHQDGEPASTHSMLQRFHAEGNSIKGAELSMWLGGWRLQPHLQALLLARNQLSDAGAGVLQQAFSCSPASQLLQLDLTCNAVGPAGTAHLVQLLQQQPTLEELKLDSNRLHDAGAAALLPVVSVHPSLKLFRAEQCRVLDMELKSKLLEIGQALAVRLRRQGSDGSSSSSDEAQPLRPVRIGTRFPPQDYQPHGVAVQPPQPVATESGAKQIRMGSRFPPHVYARVQMMDEDEGESGMGAQGGMGHCGKHVLGAEERAANPRASKVHEFTASKGVSYGGGSAGSKAVDISPFGARAWQPGSPAHDACAVGHGAELASDMLSGNSGLNQGNARYPERYSVDLHTSSSLASMDTSSDRCSQLCHSPVDTAGTLSPDAITGHTRYPHQGRMTSSKSVDITGNRAGAQGGQAGSLPGTYSCGQHQQPSPHSSSGQTYLVVRPSLRKKPLTPEQQAVFSNF